MIETGPEARSQPKEPAGGVNAIHARAASESVPPPAVSVIILSYNGRDFLPECLRSLLTSVDDRTEILVVDNNSADGSADIVAASFPGVQLFRNPVNSGYGEGNNLAASRARGEFLVFLNQDTIVTPGWLPPLITALQDDRKAGMATSKILLLADRGRINAAGNNVHLTGLTLCRGLGREADEFSEMTVVGAVSGAAFAMRRELFQRVRGFDGSFFTYMEDTDLSLRVQLAGYHCLFVPDSVVYHDYRLSFGPRKSYYQERNRYQMLLKIFRRRTLALLSPALILGELVSWGFVLLRDRRRWSNKVCAYWYILKERAAIREKRKQAQELRRARDRDILRGLTDHLEYGQTGGYRLARAAHFTFDPLFWIWRRLLLTVVYW